MDLLLCPYLSLPSTPPSILSKSIYLSIYLDVGAAEIGALVANPDCPLLLLDLEGNDINTPSSLRIFDPQCHLEVLDLSYNPLGETGGLELASYVQNNVKLQSLLVSGSNLNLKASIGLITSLHENQNLSVLGMDKPLLNFSKQEEVTDHISRVLLDKSSGLRELSLRFHGLQDRGARLLSDALSRNIMLTHINLESNKICVAGAEALASVLILQQRQRQADPRARRNYIQSIKLSHNFICDEGALALAEVSFSCL